MIAFVAVSLADHGGSLTTTDDGRGGLDDASFSHHGTKDGRVFISWRGRQVMVLMGSRARSSVRRMAGLDAAQQQIVMAKVTGNFKRGNER